MKLLGEIEDLLKSQRKTQALPLLVRNGLDDN